ncbi:ligase-associated DNA damage response exonuclease [Cereibacter sphaeroides]|uniref:ligase-associated DNA damage response exonuclease n=1 Tax=Cereibacter sphaeroides TaxID=1063 RepID=UPI001F43D872|nr:ligase-associated DNA damage response exonuclease [Cereibacter sphaeroides]MCE6961479.1 ligase-associated DNA damage response exonuclease [Cereibacter sphaeroides]MCE6967340.1 ligase-associated DNA damage response exonuclease [Cereibacter sphaeroides]MCE6971490.1 ligase-associated DNA damage response exonuclease [Cereibacter sphaeroides]
MSREPLLTFTDRGICCPEGGFHIDPWRPVERALITHGHSDHARFGHGSYLATEGSAPVIRYRLGEIDLSTIRYGERRQIGGVTVSFHPAGHVPGSAQIRIERAGEVWVVSGDYKTDADGLSEPFEPVACHAFISECTFGLPVFRWKPQAEIAGDLNTWWSENAAAGRASIIGAYTLGKAQRIMAAVDASIGPILTHGAVEATTAVLREQGLPLPPTLHAGSGIDGKSHPGALVIAPPSALGTTWANRFGPAAEAFASGWMALRGVRRRRGLARGFVMSDHADWDGLNAAVRATGAERVFVTHGYTAIFRRWLEEQGYDAGIVATEYEGEASDAAEAVVE